MDNCRHIRSFQRHEQLVTRATSVTIITSVIISRYSPIITAAFRSSSGGNDDGGGGGRSSSARNSYNEKQL